MVGINIASNRKEPIADLIIDGVKQIETRNSPTLRPFVGDRVGIVETGKGKAKLVGYVTIVKEIIYGNKEDFYKDVDKHQVNEDSVYAFKKVKYGYILTDPERLETPIQLGEWKPVMVYKHQKCNRYTARELNYVENV